MLTVPSVSTNCCAHRAGPRNPTLCCASIAEANQVPFAGHPSLDKSAQSVILCAARQNSRNSQWTTSVVPEPFSRKKKVGASPSQSHPPRVCFPAGRRSSSCSHSSIHRSFRCTARTIPPWSIFQSSSKLFHNREGHLLSVRLHFQRPSVLPTNPSAPSFSSIASGFTKPNSRHMA